MYNVRNTLQRVGFKQLGWLIIVLVQLAVTVNAGNLSSTVNRNQINPNETLTLTVSYDEQVDSSQLDLKSLEQDFDVLGISPQTSNSISIVNGQANRQASTIWTITLIAKRSGTLTIPAFSIQQDRSRAISIQATDSAAVPASELPLTARVSTDRASIFPSQQLIVEVELSAQSNISDLNGPQLIINGADVELLDQQRYQQIDNGLARQVVTLRYAAYANQQGDLIIPAMTYTGIKGGQRSLFGTRGQQVIARTTQLEVPVTALPPSNGAQWFPADDVQIAASWSSDTTDIKVGEPITRTITVTAKGQRASLIPPFAEPSGVQNYKTYQDQPQLKDQKTSQGFVGIRTESEAIVASIEGELTLPELKVQWWDVNKNRLRTAVLPAQTHSVSAANIADMPPGGEHSLETSDLLAGTANSPQYSSNPIWQWLTVLLALLCLLQFYLLYKLRDSNAPQSSINNPEPSETAEWASLQTSFKRGEPKAIRKDLLRWAKLAVPGLTHVSLQTICAYADHFKDPRNAGLSSALTALDAHLYQGENAFDPDLIANEINTLRKQIQERQKRLAEASVELPPLYQN
ncbi:MAG: hypothetical protein ACI9LY_000328 [Arenicella sp.]|jgi:hypothetical protein